MKLDGSQNFGHACKRGERGEKKGKALTFGKGRCLEGGEIPISIGKWLVPKKKWGNPDEPAISGREKRKRKGREGELPSSLKWAKQGEKTKKDTNCVWQHATEGEDSGNSKLNLTVRRV